MNIYLKTYGCTANKADASLIKGVLVENNHKLISSIEEADIIIVLTCTVIDTTEQKILSYLRKIKSLRKKIVVAGCMASIQQEKIKKILPEALLLPPQYSHHIIDLIEDKKVIFKDKNKTNFPKYFNDITAPISISEGCMFSCSYCITSLARGKLRSFPINEIKKDICYAIKNGCKEIQITSQDTSSYGSDINSDLGELLKNITTLKGYYRVRIGMMNPYTCYKNLNSIISNFKNQKIYKFLHLPVQSGDDNILKKMNRKYNVNDFLEIVKKFRKYYPDTTISTDVIVGFPGENEEQFQNTLNLLKNIKPDITNITRFSARPFTKAKKLDGRIKTETAKERSKKLTDLCSKISKQNNLKHIGKKYNILVTEEGKNKTVVGRSGNYKPVVINKVIKIGEFYPVEITDAKSTYLVGSII